MGNAVRSWNGGTQDEWLSGESDSIVGRRIRLTDSLGGYIIHYINGD
ncbi:MAG: hypothetical protein ACYCTV_02595 [Leptospirales bacterium]